MSRDPHEWLKRSTTFSRLVNPELHAKPNLMVGAIGTGVFVFVVGQLFYLNYSHNQKQTVAAATNKTPKLELVIKSDDA